MTLMYRFCDNADFDHHTAMGVNGNRGEGSAADLPFVPQLCYTEIRNRSNRVAKSETIRARVEPALKREAEDVLRRLGMTPTEAITMFYKQVTLNRGLPFPVRIPNAATRRALQDVRSGKNMERFDSASEWAEKMRSL